MMAVGRITWICILAVLSLAESSAGLFSSRETRSYRKFRDAAQVSLAQGNWGLARTNLLAAHAALAGKKFRNRYYVESLAGLTEFFLEQREPHLSEPYLRILLGHYLEKRGTNSLEAAYAYYLRGRMQIGLHRFDAAEASLLQAKAIVLKRTGMTSVQLGYVLAHLGRLYVYSKRNKEAVPVLKRSLMLLSREGIVSQSVFGRLPRPLDVVSVRTDYVLALTISGSVEESKREVQLGEDRYNQVYPKGNYSVYGLWRGAYALEASGNLPGAEILFRRAVKGLAEDDDCSVREKLRAQEELLEFYVRQQMDEKAQEQENLLVAAGVSVDFIHELNVRSEALRRARLGDEEL